VTHKPHPGPRVRVSRSRAPWGWLDSPRLSFAYMAMASLPSSGPMGLTSPSLGSPASPPFGVLCFCPMELTRLDSRLLIYVSQSSCPMGLTFSPFGLTTAVSWSLYPIEANFPLLNIHTHTCLVTDPSNSS
jgi:hypothetical protein